MIENSLFVFGAIAFFGYLAGSLPFGYWVALLVANVDIRTQGSGNIGATNIGRTLGAKWGILVLFLDCFKGLLPTMFLSQLLLEIGGAESDQLLHHTKVLCGLFTIVGHMFPVWLKFRGGKGVATALGVAIALGGWATLAALGTFIVGMLLCRIVSLSSIIAAIVFGAVRIATLPSPPFSEDVWSLTAFSLFVPTLIIVRHRANLGRIFRGEEKKFQFHRSRSE